MYQTCERPYTFVNSVECSQHYFRFAQSHVYITHPLRKNHPFHWTILKKRKIIHFTGRYVELKMLPLSFSEYRNALQPTANDNALFDRYSHMEVSSTSHSSPWIPSGSATTKTFDTATSSTGYSSRTHSPDCTICVHGSQGTKNSGTK